MPLAFFLAFMGGELGSYHLAACLKPKDSFCDRSVEPKLKQSVGAPLVRLRSAIEQANADAVEFSRE